MHMVCAHLGPANLHEVEAMGFRNLSVDCACVCLSLPALLPKIWPLASGPAGMILSTMPLLMDLLPSLVLGPVPGDGLGLLGGRDLLVKTSPSRGLCRSLQRSCPAKITKRTQKVGRMPAVSSWLDRG
jgi:hypothetical protein